jgi:hypothetical protein
MIVRYRTQRNEIWRWYWMYWRASLWRTWLLYGAAAFCLTLLASYNGGRWPQMFLAAMCPPILLWAFLAIFPQVMFKSKERIFEIGPNGIDTEIGGNRVHRDWNEIASITDKNGVIAIVVARTRNAFLVPDRAFESAKQRDSFLRQAIEFHAAARAAAAR